MNDSAARLKRGAGEHSRSYVRDRSAMRASGSSRTRSTCAAAHAAAESCVMRPQILMAEGSCSRPPMSRVSFAACARGLSGTAAPEAPVGERRRFAGPFSWSGRRESNPHHQLGRWLRGGTGRDEAGRKPLSKPNRPPGQDPVRPADAGRKSHPRFDADGFSQCSSGAAQGEGSRTDRYGA